MRGRQQDSLRQTANTPLAWTKLSYDLVHGAGFDPFLCGRPSQMSASTVVAMVGVLIAFCIDYRLKGVL